MFWKYDVNCDARIFSKTLLRARRTVTGLNNVFPYHHQSLGRGVIWPFHAKSAIISVSCNTSVRSLEDYEEDDERKHWQMSSIICSTVWKQVNNFRAVLSSLTIKQILKPSPETPASQFVLWLFAPSPSSIGKCVSSLWRPLTNHDACCCYLWACFPRAKINFQRHKPCQKRELEIKWRHFLLLSRTLTGILSVIE